MRQRHWFVGIMVGLVVAGCSDSGKEATQLLACSGEGSGCAGNLMCVEGFCRRLVAPGGSCLSSDAWCSQGSCVDGVCTSSGEPVSCDASDACSSGFVCVNGSCLKQALPGESCGPSSVCVRGECTDGTCLVTVGPGQACTSSKACPQTYECEHNACLKPVNGGGDCRSSLTYCISGTCVDGKCVSDNPDDNELKGQDTDGDTIVDYWDRCDIDTDGDTTPDCEDLDSDNDTIPDSRENYEGFGFEPTDSNGDGIYDFISLDSDGNGIPDAQEGRRAVLDDNGEPVLDAVTGEPMFEYVDTDGDTILDSSSPDNDGDGLEDTLEIYGLVHPRYEDYALPPVGADCNGDTIPDDAGTLEKPFDCDGDTVPDYLSTDSDGDTVEDMWEFRSDSDGDGYYDRYEQDSDNDGLTDSQERGDGDMPARMDGALKFNFQSADIDGDGLIDGLEVDCGELGLSMYTADTDGDGALDASEYAAAVYVGRNPADFICNAELDVKSVFDFYFELPYGGSEQRDNLEFKPAVSKLDVVFNVDTTNSMGDEVGNLKSRIRDTIVPQIRDRVEDSAFGVSRFDDFPTRGTPGSAYDYLPGYALKYGYGRAIDDEGKVTHDTPFELLGAPLTVPRDDADALAAVEANINKLSLHNGGDLPESGYESLYQLVMADDRTRPQTSWYAYQNYSGFTSGTLPYVTPGADRWGGGMFRRSSLPVVVHITDTTSHDSKAQPYDPTTVENAHYSDDVHDAYIAKGARIISIYTKSASQLPQLIETSSATRSLVPVCAFRQSDLTWRCGEDKCCTVEGTGVDPVSDESGTKQCVLSYAVMTATNLSTSLIDGVDAIVKYATYDVAAVVRGEPIEGSSHDTSCFIKRVEALADGYVAPPQEPETSCNPVAQPAEFEHVGYHNGYSNFAPGTSSSTRPGASLNFAVVAENDICVKPKSEAQVFKAYIDVIDPTTQMVFGTHQVSIIVPGEKSSGVN